MAILVIFLICTNLLTVTAAIWGASHGYLTFDKGTDIAAIALMAATLVVAAVGVIVAIVTFLGYKDIKEASVKAASEYAETAMKKIIEKAEAIAARTARETPKTETSPEDAEGISRAEEN